MILTFSVPVAPRRIDRIHLGWRQVLQILTAQSQRGAGADRERAARYARLRKHRSDRRTLESLRRNTPRILCVGTSIKINNCIDSSHWYCGQYQWLLSYYSLQRFWSPDQNRCRNGDKSDNEFQTNSLSRNNIHLMYFTFIHIHNYPPPVQTLQWQIVCLILWQ